MKLSFKHYLNEGLGLLSLNYFIGLGQILLEKEKINQEIFGIIIILTITSFTIINITQGYLNPTIGLANTIIKKENWTNFSYLAISQLIGSILGELLLKYTLHEKIQYIELKLSSNESIIKTTLYETLITILMISIIIIVTIKKKDNKIFIGVIHGLIIGMFTIIKGSLMILNPSRYIGIAVINMDFSLCYIYFLFPLLGTLLVGFIFRIIFFSKTKLE